LPILHGDAT